MLHAGTEHHIKTDQRKCKSLTRRSSLISTDLFYIPHGNIPLPMALLPWRLQTVIDSLGGEGHALFTRLTSLLEHIWSL